MCGKKTTRQTVCALFMLSLALLSLPAKAEMYIAGQVGANIPSSLSNVEYSAFGVTLGGNDLSLQDSLMYGAKAGYYFDSLKFQNFNLGVETEAFNATPHIKQQNYTIGGVNFGTGPGLTNRVLTWAPVNLIVRYQAGAVEPYAGVGLGVFFSRISDGTDSSSSTDVGLNTQLGLRFRVTTNLAFFGEWKFNYSNISHDNVIGSTLNVSADYTAHNLAFGIGYHF